MAVNFTPAQGRNMGRGIAGLFDAIGNKIGTRPVSKAERAAAFEREYAATLGGRAMDLSPREYVDGLSALYTKYDLEPGENYQVRVKAHKEGWDENNKQKIGALGGKLTLALIGGKPEEKVAAAEEYAAAGGDISKFADLLKPKDLPAAMQENEAARPHAETLARNLAPVPQVDVGDFLAGLGGDFDEGPKPPQAGPRFAEAPPDFSRVPEFGPPAAEMAPSPAFAPTQPNADLLESVSAFPEERAEQERLLAMARGVPRTFLEKAAAGEFRAEPKGRERAPLGWKTVTTNEGVFAYDPLNPDNKKRLGGRPARGGGSGGRGTIGSEVSAISNAVKLTGQRYGIVMPEPPAGLNDVERTIWTMTNGGEQLSAMIDKMQKIAGDPAEKPGRRKKALDDLDFINEAIDAAQTLVLPDFQRDAELPPEPPPPLDPLAAFNTGADAATRGAAAPPSTQAPAAPKAAPPPAVTAKDFSGAPAGAILKDTDEATGAVTFWKLINGVPVQVPPPVKR